MQKAVVKKHRESLGREMSLQLATSPRAENREKAPCGAMFLKPIAVGQTVTSTLEANPGGRDASKPALAKARVLQLST